MSTLEEKHQQLEHVIGRFRKIQVPTVDLLLIPCGSHDLGSARGFVMHSNETRPTNPHPVSIDSGVITSEPLEQVSSIKINETLHVQVNSPVTGYLHLFNFGTTGDASRLIPIQGELPYQLPANQPTLINGFPERLLVIITKEQVTLEASDLHPDWANLYNGAASRGGWNVIDRKAKVFELPMDKWSWGLCEAAVEAA